MWYDKGGPPSGIVVFLKNRQEDIPLPFFAEKSNAALNGCFMANPSRHDGDVPCAGASSAHVNDCGSRKILGVESKGRRLQCTNTLEGAYSNAGPFPAGTEFYNLGL